MKTLRCKWDYHLTKYNTVQRVLLPFPFLSHPSNLLIKPDFNVVSIITDQKKPVSCYKNETTFKKYVPLHILYLKI